MQIDDFARFLEEPASVRIVDEAIVKDAINFVDPKSYVRLFVVNLLFPGKREKGRDGPHAT